MAARKAVSADPRKAETPAVKGSHQPSQEDVTHVPFAPNLRALARNHEPEAEIGRRLTTNQRQERERRLSLVRVHIPKPFNFTHDDHSMKRYEVGEQDVPVMVAEDSFALAHGLKVLPAKK